MKKLKKVTLGINTNAGKEQVWDLLFNRFGEVNLFNPLIEGSNHTIGVKGEVGCERKCDINSRNSIHEKIVSVKGNDSFDIEIIRGGMPMMDEMIGTFKLQKLSANQTKVSFTMGYNTKPAFIANLIKGMTAKMAFKILVGLKYHLETGKLVTKKNIKSIIKKYKQLDENEGFVNKQKLVLVA